MAPDTQTADQVVYVLSTLACSTPEGLPIILTEGDTWAADDPVVRARPDLFTDDPSILRRSSRVETATARPGEQRAVRIPR
jgi:hypothetical protein